MDVHLLFDIRLYDVVYNEATRRGRLKSSALRRRVIGLGALDVYKNLSVFKVRQFKENLKSRMMCHCVSVLFFYVGLFVVNSSSQRRLASWLPFEESRCFYTSDLRRECGRGQSSIASFLLV